MGFLRSLFARKTGKGEHHAHRVEASSQNKAADVSNLLLEFVHKVQGKKYIDPLEFYNSNETVRILAVKLGLSRELVIAAIETLRIPVDHMQTGISSQSFGGAHYSDSVRMNSGLAAVEKICGIENEFTTGVLRLISTKHDIVIEISSCGSIVGSETLDFSQWRQLARQELIRRGIEA